MSGYNAAHETKSTYSVASLIEPGQEQKKVYAASTADVEAAVASSKRAFAGWRDTPVTARRSILLKASQLFKERIPELIGVETEETSSGTGFAGYEIAVLASDLLEETACAMNQALRGETAPPDPTGKQMIVERVPFGCVLGIAPWNAPVVLGLRSVIGAIAAGNVAIMKTSEYSPTVHTALAQVLIDAGLPKGVLNVLHVDLKDAPSVIDALIGHEFVRKINFTGSTRVGRIIAQVAAKYLKPITLELGGKNPIVITENADLDLAANNVIFGGFLHQGQICMSASNIFIHESVLDAVSQKIAALVSENSGLIRASNQPTDLGNDKSHRLRGLFNGASLERAQDLLKDAQEHGAKLVVGEQKTGEANGTAFQPHILSGVSQKARLYREEAFAPLLALIPYKSEEEVLNIINESEYGLSASVYSTNHAQAWRLARAIESGAVHINGQTVHDSQDVVHGGVKASGYGRFNGAEGIREFTQLKVITIAAGGGTKMPFTMM
ncbi:Aldehyde dehydrogenase [Ceraceosorus bombacis]|uniref:Aldehyde dehydrogenase n=1 Tax=Ceraceosorus bombacis TaxID=401625 RepID=A0A0P1BLE7_9BASI|nr:Aldehyde dehydrogenase [Ceraceosorus bombacis]